MSRDGRTRREVLGAITGAVGLASSARATSTPPDRTAIVTSGNRGASSTVRADSFEQVAKLAPADGGYNFAIDIGIADDGTALAGNAGGQRRANVFTRTETGWTETAVIRPGEGGDDDYFGETVALSADGTTALVGSNLDDPPTGENAGSAYVFGRSDGEWSRTTKLVPGDGDAGDFFGAAVDLSNDGTVAVVAAPGDENPDSPLAGSAYVFERSDGTWTETAKLGPGDGPDRERNDGDSFGRSVSVSGDGTTTVVGTFEANFAGSAYVFDRSDGGWSETTKLTPSDGSDFDYFGQSVAVSTGGSVVAVGATDVGASNDNGRAYVYERDGGAWSETKLVGENRGDSDEFGSGVETLSDGDRVLVGAPDAKVGDAFEAGRVHVFGPDGDGWSEVTALTAADGDGNDRFGASISSSPDGTLIVGAPQDDDPHAEYGGSAYVFGTQVDACPAVGDSVTTDRLRRAIRRWAVGEIGTDCLRRFIAAWARSA